MYDVICGSQIGNLLLEVTDILIARIHLDLSGAIARLHCLVSDLYLTSTNLDRRVSILLFTRSTFLLVGYRWQPLGACAFSADKSLRLAHHTHIRMVR